MNAAWSVEDEVGVHGDGMPCWCRLSGLIAGRDVVGDNFSSFSHASTATCKHMMVNLKLKPIVFNDWIMYNRYDGHCSIPSLMLTDHVE